jgi:hypothetical protein
MDLYLTFTILWTLYYLCDPVFFGKSCNSLNRTCIYVLYDFWLIPHPVVFLTDLRIYVMLYVCMYVLEQVRTGNDDSLQFCLFLVRQNDNRTQDTYWQLNIEIIKINIHWSLFIFKHYNVCTSISSFRHSAWTLIKRKFWK